MDDSEYLRLRAQRTRAEWTAGYMRVLEARSPVTTPARFADLADDEIRAVRVWLGRNPRCPASTLDALARDEYGAVHWSVLNNPSTLERTLRYLAEAESANDRPGERLWDVVRSRVLSHPNVGRRLKRELRAVGVRTVHEKYNTKVSRPRWIRWRPKSLMK